MPSAPRRVFSSPFFAREARMRNTHAEDARGGADHGREIRWEAGEDGVEEREC